MAFYMYVAELAFKQEGQCLTSENIHHRIVRKIDMIGNINVSSKYE